MAHYGSNSRSRRGCLTCRARHIKCDEGRPTCSMCRKARRLCRQPDFIHALPLSLGSSIDNNNGPADSGQTSGRLPYSSSYSRPSLSPLENRTNIEKCDLSWDASNAHSMHVSDPSTALTQIVLPVTEKLRSAAASLTESSLQSAGPFSSPPSISSQTAFLLRTYETGIGTWMDVFDCSLSYQQGLLLLVLQSPLLLNSTCALAARQLSLITCPRTWTPVAEYYYGESLSLLRSSLNDSTVDTEHALVATILMSSYELLAFPGHNYHRHFRGAKSLVEALEAYKSPKRMTRASFWIYARHEVGEAMNLERPTMQDPISWPKPDTSREATGEDLYCNDALRLCGEVIHFIFGSTEQMRRKKWANQWLGLHSDWYDWLHGCPGILSGREYIDQESRRRYWFPRPSFAAAMCFYHICQVFLFSHYPKTALQTMAAQTRTISIEDQIQNHAEMVIDIALSNMPDGVLVTMMQPVFHAARHVNDAVRKGEAIVLLETIQKRTGFHTKSNVESLKTLIISS